MSKYSLSIFVLLIVGTPFLINSRKVNVDSSGSEILKKISERVSNHAERTRFHTNEDDKGNSLCNNDERQFLDIESQLIDKISSSLLSKSASELNNLMTSEFKSIAFPPSSGSMSNDFKDEGMKEYLLLTNREQTNNAKDYINNVKSYLENVERVDYAKFDTLDMYSNNDMRDEKKASTGNTKFDGNTEINSANLLVRFDIRKMMKNGKKINDRGEMNISVLRQNSQWKISKMELLKGTSVVSEGQIAFREITPESFNGAGLPMALRREAIRRGGYATSVGDFDNDGIQDIFFASADKTKLYKGNENGVFVEQLNTGLENHTLVKSSAFVDLFNSGKQDLILARFNPSRSLSSTNYSSDIIVYKNLGNGKFEKIESPLNFKNRHDYAMPMALADFNQDGLLDIYIGFPGSKDFTIMKEKNIDTNKLQRYGFFFNQGARLQKFNENEKNDISWEKKFEKNFDHFDVYPHSASAVDFNLDGFMDIVTIDDRANLSPAFMGMPGGKLKQVNEQMNFSVSDYGMGVTFGDVFGTGRMDMLMTSVNFIPAQRIKSSCRTNWSYDRSSVAGEKGLRFYKNEGRYFSEISNSVGLDFAGEGLAGVELIDYNNDGNLDIFVSNGLWSGTDRTSKGDLTSLITRSSSLGLFEEDFTQNLKNASNFNQPLGAEKVFGENDNEFLSDSYKSQSAIVNMLISAKTSNDKNFSFAGFQRKRVYRNNGNGSFTEVAYGLGLDSEADGYMVGFTDINKDGKLDIVYRNADPGVNVKQFSPLELYANNLSENNSVILKLSGRNKSNRDAIGAIVTALVNKKTIVRQLTAMSGTIQSEKMIHVGLGKNTKIEKLEIRWPDGTKQNIKNLDKGFHYIVQPDETIRSAQL
jgi:hypothetical protein